MNAAMKAPVQPAADLPPMDDALRNSLARKFQVPEWQVDAIYREELCRLAASARISTYLGVLVTHRVQVRLGR